MNKLFGIIRDTNYYLFIVGGWKWLIIIALLANIARCSLEFNKISEMPNCREHRTSFDLTGKVTTSMKCKQTKEEEKFLCQLLQVDLRENKKK